MVGTVTYKLAGIVVLGGLRTAWEVWWEGYVLEPLVGMTIGSIVCQIVKEIDLTID